MRTLVIAVSVAFWIVSAGGPARAAVWVPRSCGAGANVIGQPASEAIGNRHGNLIREELDVAVIRGQAEWPIGWVYRTYGGREYFQFEHPVTVEAGIVRYAPGSGPVFPFRGSFNDLVLRFAGLAGTLPRNLPQPLNWVPAGARVAKSTC